MNPPTPPSPFTDKIREILDGAIPCECFATEGHAYNCDKQKLPPAHTAILTAFASLEAMQDEVIAAHHREIIRVLEGLKQYNGSFIKGALRHDYYVHHSIIDALIATYKRKDES